VVTRMAVSFSSPRAFQRARSANFLSGSSQQSSAESLRSETLRDLAAGKAGRSNRLLSRAVLLARQMFRPGWAAVRFRWSRDRFVAHSFSALAQSSDVFSVPAAAFKIQLMSSASDLFWRWFLLANISTLLDLVSTRAEAPTSVCEMWISCRFLRR